MGYQQKVVCQISERLKFQAKKTQKTLKIPKNHKKNPKNHKKNPKNPKKPQKIPKNPSRYTKIGKLGLGFFGIFWDFFGIFWGEHPPYKSFRTQKSWDTFVSIFVAPTCMSLDYEECSLNMNSGTTINSILYTSTILAQPF